jgi:predicted DNA-binding protein YlxM (UPF0122 family)
MGRKSILTEKQWIEIERRHLINDESINSLAKEFGINESSIRRKIMPNNAESKNSDNSLMQLAKRKVEIAKEEKEIAEKIAEIPMVRQLTFNSLVAKMTNISNSLASAAECSAATAHRLSALANQESSKIDDADPLKSFDALSSVANLQELASEASKIPLKLLAATKDFTKSDKPGVESGLDAFYGDE